MENFSHGGVQMIGKTEGAGVGPLSPQPQVLTLLGPYPVLPIA